MHARLQVSVCSGRRVHPMGNDARCVIEISREKKSLVHKGVYFYVQNVPKTHIRASLIPKFFPRLYPRSTVKKEGEWKGKEGRERGKGCVMAFGGWTPLFIGNDLCRSG